MSTIWDTLGLNAQQVEEIEEAGQGKAKVQPGVYEAEIERVYTRTTNSGAVMLEIDYKLDNGMKFHQSANIVKRNGEPNDIGLGVLKTIALKTVKDPMVPSEPCRIDHFGNVINAQCMPSLTGQHIILAIKHKEDTCNGNVFMRPEVVGYVGVDEEDTAEKVTDWVGKIEVNPIIIPRKRPEQPAVNQAEAQVASNSGW
jgi:hypothetical protein